MKKTRSNQTKRSLIGLLHSSKKESGFTLLELLIAAFISSLVVSGLLYVVTELLRIDNREIALEEVQRDTQRAMNYIADEIREAVYVYTDPTTVTSPIGVGDALPGGSIPIIAFWKVSPIAQSDMPPGNCMTTFTDEVDQNNCRTLKVRRASYDLVVYSLLPGPAEPWEGPARISRYELKQYSDSSTLTETPGYIDPSSNDSSFEDWVKDTGETLPNSPAGSAVLVDYMAGVGTTGNAVNCPTFIPSNDSDSFTGNDSDQYTVSPPGALDDSSFFACIRNPGAVQQLDGQTARSNQDVYLFLQGDASARGRGLNPASEASRSPILQTQVMVRGVINKEPDI